MKVVSCMRVVWGKDMKVGATDVVTVAELVVVAAVAVVVVAVGAVAVVALATIGLGVLALLITRPAPTIIVVLRVCKTSHGSAHLAVGELADLVAAARLAGRDGALGGALPVVAEACRGRPSHFESHSQ